MLLKALLILFLLLSPVPLVWWMDRTLKRGLEALEGEPIEFPDPPPRRTPDQLRQVLQVDVWDLVRESPAR